MPTVILSRKVVESLTGKKLSLEMLKDRISMLGTDLKQVAEQDIEVEIFPNRPDMLSEQGFARALSSFIGEKTGLKRYEVKKSGEQVIIDSSVAMRQWSACAIVKNISFDDERIREIMQTQEKLAKTHGRDRKKSEYGLYPLEKINFPVTYIAKDPHKVMFQPLGFEKKMPAIEVEKVHPKGKEYRHIAEGWKKYPFYIDNKDNVLSMLPYTNSNDTGKIDDTTKEVFIECSGTDFNNVNIALNIFVTMLADMGGEIYSIEMVYPVKKITTPDLTPSEMPLDLGYINKRLGLSLTERDAKLYLERMGYGYEKKKVLIPAYRADILHQADLMEDIAIAYGYEKIKEEIPQIATLGRESEFEKFKEKIAQILVGSKLLEVNTYHLSNAEYQNKNMGVSQPLITISNSVTEEYQAMRSWLTPCLLEVLKNNKHNEFPQNIFMLGSVFKKNALTETGVEEPCHLCVMQSYEGSDYTMIRQILDYVFLLLHIPIEIAEAEHPSFIPGRVASILIDKKKIGYIGELSPAVLSNFSLNMPTACFELNLSAVYEMVKK